MLVHFIILFQFGFFLNKNFIQIHADQFPNIIPVHVIYDPTTKPEAHIVQHITNNDQKMNLINESENFNVNNFQENTIRYQPTTVLTTSKPNQIQHLNQKIQQMFQVFFEKVSSYNEQLYHNIIDPMNTSMIHLLDQLQHNASNYHQIMYEHLNKLTQFMNNIIQKPQKQPQPISTETVGSGGGAPYHSQTGDAVLPQAAPPLSSPASDSIASANGHLLQGIKDTFQNFLNRLNKTLDSQLNTH